MSLLQEFHRDREYQALVKCKNPLRHKNLMNMRMVKILTLLRVNCIFLKYLSDNYGSCINMLPVSWVIALYRKFALTLFSYSSQTISHVSTDGAPELTWEAIANCFCLSKLLAVLREMFESSKTSTILTALRSRCWCSYGFRSCLSSSFG